MTGLEQLLGQELHRQRAADLERAAEEHRAATAARNEERRTGEAEQPASARSRNRRGRIAVA
ncbi:hypothetical protein [Streptomyces sp. NPDC127098]|uniref:hypothetical protein n=1 Tax=Streptomyces sp. NPDC127098 TaxID=3347137 RepID=UPI003655E45A